MHAVFYTDSFRHDLNLQLIDCMFSCLPIITVLRPRLASSEAKNMPAGPAPTTATSYIFVSGGGKTDAMLG